MASQPEASASSSTSNPPTSTASLSKHSPVLLEARTGGEGINLSLHPLPILNVSEHFTRSRIQNPSEPARQVYGALLGTQSSRDIEIQNTFEILIKQDSTGGSGNGNDNGKGKDKSQAVESKGVQVDTEFLKSRLAQFKQVFPTFEFLGWYSVGMVPTPADLEVHKQLIDFNEAPLFLQLTPTVASFNTAQSSGELPISLYESVVELAPASAAQSSEAKSPSKGKEGAVGEIPKEAMEATMFFVPAPYHIETGEAERIAVDHTSKPPEDGEGEASAMLANLQTQQSSISMLSDRIKLVLTYMQSVQSGALPKDHESLRQISSLLSNLPAGEGDQWKEEYLTEYNDVMMTSYLASLTKSLNTMNELVDKHDLLSVNEERQNRSGGGGGARRRDRGFGGRFY